MNELFGKVATIRSYDTNENMTMDLAAGRVDGTLADYFVLKTFLERQGWRCGRILRTHAQRRPLGARRGHRPPQDRPAIEGRFEKAIASANEDRAIKALTEKWFGMDMSPPK